MATHKTVPTLMDDDDSQRAPHLIVAEHYEAPDGSVWVHGDLNKAVEPWAVEQHVGPVDTCALLGNVESFVAYLARYALPHVTLAMHNDRGLLAFLDYHDMGVPGRCQWMAEYQYEYAPQWRNWTDLASGKAMTQRQLVESLEDLAEDIVSPDQAKLLGLLRQLRTSVNATAETTLAPDGSYSVSWAKDAKVTGSADLPPIIQILVPVLRGHVDEAGKQVAYRVDVRLRANVGDDGRLAFRLSIPARERVLEQVRQSQVDQARELLADTGITLLRGA